MAKVVAPLMSQEVRGKMGGLVFNTYRGIATCKSLKSPVQPNTAAQTNARSRMTDASRAWAELTSVQRDAWEVYAASHIEADWTSKPKRLTGHNWFCRCYSRAILAGGSPITDVPAVAAPAAPAITSIAHNAAGGGTIEVTYTTPPASGTVWVFYGCGPISDGRVPKLQMASIKLQVDHADSSPDSIYTAPVSGRYGIWYRAIDSATGLASALTMVDIASW